MSAPIPITQPASINAGDTAKWLVSPADFLASEGWTLTVTLVSAAQRYTISSTAYENSYLVTATAATTANWVPGTYATRTTVSKAGEVYTVAQGSITVAPSFGAAVDARSLAQRQLDAVEATIEGRASSDVLSYQIAGREMRKIPLTELLVLRDRLRVDVQREQNALRAAQGLAPKGRVFVRFGA